jgi:hypothetical protein
MKLKELEKLRDFVNKYLEDQGSKRNHEDISPTEIADIRRILNQKDAEKCIKILLSAAQVAQLIKIIVEFFLLK